MNRTWQTVVSVIVILLSLGLLIGAVAMWGSAPQPSTWSYSDLVKHAQAGQVKDVTISGTDAAVTDTTGKQYDVTLPDQTESLASTLTAAGVNVHYQSSGGFGNLLGTLLPNIFLFGLIGLMLWWGYRSMRRSQGQAM